ncbi:MAG: hypothetical protein JSU63_13785 [Phycisphaerales bacterium]|nr:MAG: hypothetical protein JSU63_13785 [Phycisphaerales bacterium]
MFKTLGCLVAATSGTAVLLGWMAPVQPAPAFAISPAELVRLANTAVLEDVPVESHQWIDIKVTTDSAGVFDEGMLAARVSSDAWHFHVDHDGYPSRSRDWSTQRGADEAPGTVRILVSQSHDDHTVSAAQWISIRALVTAINATFSEQGGPLPVRLHEEWAAIHGVTPVTYFEIPPVGPSAD